MLATPGFTQILWISLWITTLTIRFRALNTLLLTDWRYFDQGYLQEKSDT